ncbi:hypothetical protein SBI_01048 [Streptomyces bingchenggensis BCW-1]|uniref:Uncharacterized protein n=1 Tax=Streptomyces bingchenggensis (strain BCW-1) TaxID=749414 RepID=D7C808_STRBB|nr:MULTISPECIES: hypothetical protein [Streptomyces]ADI04169.1 hypothetical protein SBI_01048 [Streptomyces bingchenggensis BCW-1]
MLQSMTRRVSRAVEVLLPKATAEAACPPDPYYEYKADTCQCLRGACQFRRRCSTNAACKVICGAWENMDC